MPKEINGYRIVEKAQGGMAVVYKGMNSSGFCRAFKVVRPDKAVNNPALCQRFLKGIQILKSLDHPNIIKALNAFTYVDDETGETYTVLEMDWLDGMDLEKFVKEKTPNGILPDSVKKICYQVIEGLQYAHDKHILHLDIKPNNLFRTKDGYIKIIDFGIAKIIGENADIVEGAEMYTTKTETGESTSKGTLAYASPEQQEGGKLTVASDIYSFGKTLHFLLTGTDDPSVEVTVEPFAAIIDKCTEQNPNKRFAGFNQLKLALEGIGNKKERVCINPACHQKIAENVRYCPYCGKEQIAISEVTKKCPKCGRESPLGNSSCYCGYIFTSSVSKRWKCKSCYRSLPSEFNDNKNNYCCYCGSKEIAYVEA